MPGIRLDALGKRYASVTAVDDLTLDIVPGEFLVLLGPSGCGKTTVLRMIAGLLAPSTGRILLDERDITDEPPRRRDVAMVFQSYALYPHLTVARNIGFGLRVRRLPADQVKRRVGEAARLLDLEGLLDRRPKELSGGQRQRVALGRAIVRSPRAFLMDEPLSNLDAKLRTVMRQELADLHRRLGTTFVYVTHDQIEAMTMASRIVVLDRGRLQQVGTPVEVYDEPATLFVAGFVGSPPMNLLPVEVSSQGGVVGVAAPGIEGWLWPGDTPPREAVLGVRPEHLTVASAADLFDGDAEWSGTGLSLRATVSAVENLGSEEVALCRVGEAGVSLRGSRPLGLRAGDGVTLTAPTARVHLFDPVSGNRLVWRPASAAADVSVPRRKTVEPASA